MRLEKVDLNLFVVFDALYREHSVTKVAQLLNLTQPAVSNALGRLRQTFDDQLFVKTREGMSPTPVADSVVKDVRQALVLLGRSVGSNARFDPARSEKVFRLGMNDLAESLLLPRLHEEVRKVAPSVAITSYYVEREAATAELKAGMIDLLLDAPVVNARELGQKPLGQLPYVIAMRPGHPLAATGLTMDDYLSAEHLHVSSRRKGRGQVELALHTQGLRRTIAMRVQNYLVAARITAGTDLLWTVPRVLAQTLPLETAELPFAVEPLSWQLFWHRNADEDPANRWMREMMEAVAQTVL
ncbi:LysR family transcriptional regulator [Microbulbifer sp. CAU 1566]|uniref:LysR family transcriptional regulator n=1 Tax=Microbulbifer sp. CAU 1566 TaxID=2933269 RepID=UPI0020064407|nr:LysR family transcriptional regulator [Microbulbifer sp. CAU 1566]MCK7597513.1 LysR family transcriptional regulator [Microbulbifer sp. CAU 1566]